MARTDSLSSISPQPPCPSSQRQGPPIAQHPNPIALTCRPERPNVRWNAFVVVVICLFPFRIFPIPFQSQFVGRVRSCNRSISNVHSAPPCAPPPGHAATSTSQPVRQAFHRLDVAALHTFAY